jgi:hypothetical protein
MEEGTVYAGAVDGMIACPLQTMSRWFPASFFGITVDSIRWSECT